MQESYCYKSDLLKFAESLKKRSCKQMWRSDSLVKVEKMIFTGFYFVRKLIESVKVTDECKKTSYLVGVLALSNDRPLSNWERWDIVDLIREQEEQEMKYEKKDINQICDKVIHAWWNMFCQSEEGGLDGMMLTTDKLNKKREVWFIPTQTMIDSFLRFGDDWPTKIEKERDENGKLIYWKCE